jgi:glycosyltransferase involved in cell wall biosynthesis
MSATSLATALPSGTRIAPVLTAVHDPRSVGIATYVERLALALAELGVDYRPARRPHGRGPCHVHLANSTRGVVLDTALRRDAFLLTVHDVIPRSAMLRPFHRALIVPLCIARAARVIVHSRHAARLLGATAGIAAWRVEVIPHPAPELTRIDRAQATAALGLDPDGPPLFVLPGALKAAKLVSELLSAARPLLAARRMRLLLAGHVRDRQLVGEAAAAGATVLSDPPRPLYEQAIVAAEAVLNVRRDTVGETNGPLLDAIGAGRPSLVTDVGSAPEVAGDAAVVVAPTVSGIRAGLELLLDDAERRDRAAAACRAAATLTWRASAQRHAELLRELAG